MWIHSRHWNQQQLLGALVAHRQTFLTPAFLYFPVFSLPCSPTFLSFFIPFILSIPSSSAFWNIEYENERERGGSARREVDDDASTSFYFPLQLSFFLFALFNPLVLFTGHWEVAPRKSRVWFGSWFLPREWRWLKLFLSNPPLWEQREKEEEREKEGSNLRGC